MKTSRSHIINTIPYIDQTTNWPTGCESVSTVMLLQYLGIQITVEEFVSFLPKAQLLHTSAGLIGADPNEYFIGSPADPNSFGCYAPVIVTTLNRIFQKYQLPYHAVNLSGIPTDTLLETYIDHDMPVIYWTTIDLKESYIGPTWVINEKRSPFTWRSNEHCMLLSGYDETHLYLHDPWMNHGQACYDRSLVIKRHGEMYEMAVGVERE